MDMWGVGIATSLHHVASFLVLYYYAHKHPKFKEGWVSIKDPSIFLNLKSQFKLSLHCLSFGIWPRLAGETIMVIASCVSVNILAAFLVFRTINACINFVPLCLG
jgi:Na+-driven multidrug efflux pump